MLMTPLRFVESVRGRTGVPRHRLDKTEPPIQSSRSHTSGEPVA